MAWSDFQEMRATMDDIDAASAEATATMLAAAPTAYFDLLDYLPDATAGVVELYGQAARDTAVTYLVATAPTILGSIVTDQPTKRALVTAAGRVALWALTETGPGQQVMTDLLLPKLYTGASRLVRSQGRGLIRDVADDPRTPISARRIPRPGACNFCRMLSLNTYSSAEAAGQVVGHEAGSRGKNHTQAQRDAYLRKYGPRRRVLRSGGSQPLGASFHDHCKCEVYVSYAGEPDDIPYETHEMLEGYMDDYYLGLTAAQKDYGVSHPSTSQILAAMRKRNGAK